MTYLLAQASAHRIPLRDESVQTCVTSPPYWGLRVYAGEQSFVWGGEEGHAHEWGELGRAHHPGQVPDGKHQHEDAAARGQNAGSGRHCPCGAWYGALGLEPTPDLFVAHMVEVFREVRRVLRKDGTLWLNLGDSYAQTAGAMRGESETKERAVARQAARGTSTGQHGGWEGRASRAANTAVGGLKPKDLVGIPWRVAFALQADGWYLRSDIVWAKPNPMPESVTDRPTKSHEYVFLLAKGRWSERAIRFANLEPERVHLGRYLGAQNPAVSTPAKFCVELATALFNGAQQECEFRLPPFYAEEWKQLTEGRDSDFVSYLPPKHRLAAHAARFLDGDTSAPEFLREVDRLWSDLRERDHLLIGRSLSQGANPPHVLVDGDGTVRVDYPGEVGKIDFAHDRIVVSVPTACSYFYDADAIREELITGDRTGDRRSYPAGSASSMNGEHQRMTGSFAGLPLNHSGRNARSVWNIATQPYPGAHFATFPEELPERCIKAGSALGDVVLDPFNGSGTTGRVAMRLGRRYVGLDLSREYLVEQAVARIDPIAAAARDFREQKDGAQGSLL